MGQLVGCIRGIGEAARALDFPIVSGNVSLYNETNGRAILPTPTIGGVGLLDDFTTSMTLALQSRGRGDPARRRDPGLARPVALSARHLRPRGGRAAAGRSRRREAQWRFRPRLIRDGLVDRGARRLRRRPSGRARRDGDGVRHRRGARRRPALPAHAFWFGEDQAPLCGDRQSADRHRRARQGSRRAVDAARNDRRRRFGDCRRTPDCGRASFANVSRLASRLYGRARASATVMSIVRAFGHRAVAARRQARCVLREAADDAAAAGRNAGAQRPLFGAAGPQDRECARVGRSVGIGASGATAGAAVAAAAAVEAAARSAAADGGDGAPAWRRKLRRVAFEALQRLGAARLHARAMRHEIGAAGGANGGGLLRRRLSRRGGRGERGGGVGRAAVRGVVPALLARRVYGRLLGAAALPRGPWRWPPRRGGGPEALAPRSGRLAKAARHWPGGTAALRGCWAQSRSSATTKSFSVQACWTALS